MSVLAPPSRSARSAGEQPAVDLPLDLSDRTTFDRLVLEHHRLACAVAYRILGSREDAEDAAQEAFLRAYRMREQFTPGCFRSWLLRIVSNQALDELRRRRRRRSHPTMHRAEDRYQSRSEVDQTPDPSPGPEDIVVRQELQARIEAGLEKLEHEMRLAVLLRDIHGLSYLQVAEVMGVPVGTVRSRISRGRAQLRAILQADEARLPVEVAPRSSVP